MRLEPAVLIPLAQTLVKAMTAPLRTAAAPSGGAVARLFSQVLEQALADAVAERLAPHSKSNR